MIELERLVKTYQDFTAVNQLSLSIGEGEVFGFLGPNGAGKTTTIRMLTGILQPDEGGVRLFGKTYAKARDEILNNMGYIPDRPYLYGKLTGMELLRFMGGLRKLRPDFVRKRGMELLELFNLENFAHQLIERYSHGMKQKLVLAGALLHDPKLLVVDEPMVGLDPRAAKLVKELILDFAGGGRTVFMSTHTLEVAEKLCSRIGIIYQGKLVADEPLESLLARIAGDQTDTDLEKVFLAMTQDETEAAEAIPGA